jgi:hypothetical protein
MSLVSTKATQPESRFIYSNGTASARKAPDLLGTGLERG